MSDKVTYQPILETPEEIEAERQDAIEELAKDREKDAQEAGAPDALAYLKSHYAPGTFSCHEAMHTASVLMDSVDRHLCEHGSVILDPVGYAYARQAFRSLFDLYQHLGAEHLPVDSDGTPSQEHWRDHPVATPEG